MLNIVQSSPPTTFSYKHIASQEEAAYIKRKTEELRALDGSKERKVPARLVFAIGDILIDISERLPRDLFLLWLATEARISDTTASKYIKTAKVFSDNRKHLEDISSTVLYYLTLPSYPQFFLDAILSGNYKPDLRSVRMMRLSEPTETTTEQQVINTINTSIEASTIQDLAAQMALMQQQLSAINAVEKHITPPEILEENQQLSKEVLEYRSAWEDVVKENQRLIEERKASIVDKSITSKQYETLLEEHEKVKKERDVLLENWNAISKKHKEAVGKLQSLVALTKNFTEACSVLCKDEEG